MTSSTTMEQKRQIQARLLADFGIKIPVKTLKLLSWDQLKRILAILNEK